MSHEIELKQLISAKLGVPVEQVTLEADLIADLGGDSLTLAELTAAIEQQMGKRLPVDRLWDIATVGDMLELLNEMNGAGGP